MANDKSLQKPENEEPSFLEKMGTNPKVKGLVQLAALGGFMLALLSLIATIFIFLFAYPAYYRYLAVLSILGGAIFTLAGGTHYFISIRPKIKGLNAKVTSLQEELREVKQLPVENPAIISDTHKIVELENSLAMAHVELERLGRIEGEVQSYVRATRMHQKANERLEGENAELIKKIDENEKALIIATGENNVLKGELEKLKADYENDGKRFQGLYEENAELLQKIEDNKWLVDLADRQAGNIGEYLQFKFMTYYSHEFSVGVPNIVFFLTVLNLSVYDLIPEKFTGTIYFHGKPFKCELGFFEGYPQPIKTGTRDGIGIELQFGEIQAEAILKGVRNYREGVPNADIPILGFSDISLFIVAEGHPKIRARWPLKSRASVDLHKVDELYDRHRQTS